jgi:NADH-quinone oxidoreductase subunit J
VKIVDLQVVSLPELIVFAILAGAVLGGALFTITRRNPVTAVMSLVGTFFALAGIYATLSAHFLAVLQVLVYAGAIMVLFIFVIMILNREEVEPIGFKGITIRALGVVAAGYLVLVFSRFVWHARGAPALRAPVAEVPPAYGSVSEVGLSLFRDFVYPFEAVSLLLLVAIVGGVILSRSHRQDEQDEQVEEGVARRDAPAATTVSETRLGALSEASSGAQDRGAAHAAHH